MLHTKFQGHRSFGSGEEDFFFFFFLGGGGVGNINGRAGNVCHVTWTV